MNPDLRTFLLGASGMLISACTVAYLLTFLPVARPDQFRPAGLEKAAGTFSQQYLGANPTQSLGSVMPRREVESTPASLHLAPNVPIIP